MKNGKRRGQKKQKRKGAYDKSGGITYDTAAFAFRTKDILKIRSRPRLEPGSDYHYLQRAVKTDISVRNKKAVRRAAHQLRAQQSGSQLERRRKEAGG